MSQIVRTETRHRSLFGKFVLILFWSFNALMFALLVMGLASAGEVIEGAASEAERAGAGLGVTIGVTFILGFWFLGAALLGLMLAFSRGKVVVVETRQE